MLKFRFTEALLGYSLFLAALASGADYRIDTTYADGGIFKRAGGAVQGVVIQSDGTILLASTMTEASKSFSSFGLLRQNSAGVLDSGFGTGGISYTSFGTSTAARVNAMVESPVDGKVVLVGVDSGFVSSAFRGDFAVAVFNADGSPDTGFNTTGRVKTSFDNVTNASKSFAYASSEAYCAVVQPDGKIIVGGTAEVGPNNRRFALLRHNANGSIDTGFGGALSTGLVVTNPGSYCQLQAIAISPTDQKIVAVGRYQDPVSFAYRLMVVRYNTDGTLDTGFDTDGIVFTGTNSQIPDGTAVVVQPDGKILVAGATFAKTPFAEPEDFALFRFLSDGTLDPDFGTGGQVAVDVVGGYDRLDAIKLLSNGKILCAGTAGGDPADPSSVSSMALVRFNSDGTLDTGFGTGGLETSAGASSREASCLEMQDDGKIIVAGEFWADGADPSQAAAIRFEEIPTVVPVTRKTDLLLGLTSNVRLGGNIYNATGAGQTQPLALGFKATKTAFIGVQNDGSAADSFKVKGTPGDANFTVSYFKGARNVTAAIVSGSHRTPVLAPNATEILRVVVTAKSNRAAARRTLSISASSIATPAATDRALFNVTSKAKP